MGLEIGSLTRLPLGYVGESEARVIEIHVSSWLKEFPGSKIVVEVVRPDKKIYFAPTTLENGILRWTVGADEVMVAGRGYAQFAVVNVITNKEYRSRIVETIIAPSLDEFTKEELEASDPARKWANQVIAAAYAVQDVTGDLRNLNTQNKSNLVAAINEVRATGGGGSSGGTTIIGATIADGPPNRTTVWSSYYTNEILTPVKNDVSKAVRFDKDQGLGEKEQEQARKNIGITSTGADISGLIDDDISNLNGSSEKVWSSQKSQFWHNAQGTLINSINARVGTGKLAIGNDVIDAINKVNAKAGSSSGGGSSGSAKPSIVDCWGDSLTYGQLAYNYPAALGAKLLENGNTDVTVNKYGFGAETAEAILGRMGAYPLLVMPSGDVSSVPPEDDDGDNTGGGSGNEPGGDSGSGDPETFQNYNYWTNAEPDGYYSTYIQDNGIAYLSSTRDEVYKYYLFYARINAGETYKFGVKHADDPDGWREQNMSYAAFATDVPVYDLESSNPSYQIPLVEGSTVRMNFNAGDNPLGWVAPQGANYIVFCIDSATYNLYLEAEYPCTLQRMVDGEHEKLSDINSYESPFALTYTSRDGNPLTVITPGAPNTLYGGLASVTGADISSLFDQINKEEHAQIGGIEGTLWGATTFLANNSDLSPVTIKSPTLVVTKYAREVDPDRVLVLWLGQNNTLDDDLNNNIDKFADTLIKAVRVAVSFVGTERYIVLSAPTANPSDDSSARAYKPLYEKMQREFGAKYINIVDYLINYGLTDAGEAWTDGDTADKAVYKVPSSLRIDGVHLNSTGYQLVADQVYKRGKMLNYW